VKKQWVVDAEPHLRHARMSCAAPARTNSAAPSPNCPVWVSRSTGLSSARSLPPGARGLDAGV